MIIHIIIIGNSAAAINAVEIIRKYNKKANITMVSDEKELAYSPILTTYYIGEEISKEEMHIKNKEFYKKNEINRKFGNKAVEVHPEKNEILLENNEILNYDKLLIATGASPYIPDIKGINKKGVYTVRTKNDAVEIKQKAQKSKHAVILGGGLVSLKTASALKKQGLDITLIIGSNRVMSQVLDYASSQIVGDNLKDNGYNILTGHSADEIRGDNKVKEILLNTGEKISCDMVIIGKGVVPNTDLVKNTKINTDDGILVNSYMSTNYKNIYAAGDVAQSYDLVYDEKTVSGTWAVAVEQGNIAAHNIVGQKKKYRGSLTMNVIDIHDLEIGATGITRPPSQKEYQEIVVDKKNYYKKIIIRKNTIVGGVFIGELKGGGIIQSLIRRKLKLDKLEPLKEFLSDFNYAKFYKKIKKLNYEANKNHF